MGHLTDQDLLEAYEYAQADTDAVIAELFAE